MHRFPMLGLGLLAALGAIGCDDDEAPTPADTADMAAVADVGTTPDAVIADAEVTDAGEETDSGMMGDGFGARFARSAIDPAVPGSAFVKAVDFDGDAQLEVLTTRFNRLEGGEAVPGEVVVYRAADEGWASEVIVPRDEGIFFPNDVELHDVDGDGDADLVVPGGFLPCPFLPGVMTPCGVLRWYERTDDGWAPHDIVPFGSQLFFHTALFADLDGDGVEDVITVGERRDMMGDAAEARWYRGMGAGDFEPEARIIGSGLGSVPSLADIDDDGDLDLVSAEFFAGLGASAAWFEQVAPPSAESPAGGWTRHVIDDAAGPSIQFSLIEGLIEPGETYGVLSNHSNTRKPEPDPWEAAIWLYQVPDDPTTRWPGRQISEHIASVVGSPAAPQAAPGGFAAGDLDGDGDLDLLVGGDGDPRVFLLEQVDGGEFVTWTFDESLGQVAAVDVADLDGDGDDEVLVSSYDANALFVYEHDPAGAHPLRRAMPPEPPKEAGIVLDVRYDGERAGSLVVGVFESYPPMGPPAGFSLVPNPSFPQRVELPTIEAGDYEVLVFLDAAPVNPMAPGPEDAFAVVPVTAPTADPVSVRMLDSMPVEPPDEVFEIAAGQGIGPVRLGMTYAALVEALGEEPAGFGIDGSVLLNLASPSMQIVLASPEQAGPAPEALVIAMQANGAAGFSGPVRPGMSRVEVLAEAGEPTLVVGDIEFYGAGYAVTYADGTATNLAVWPPYEVAFPVPEMLPPATETGGERPVLDPATIGQVDMHLHFGRPGQLPESGARFTTAFLPPFLQAYRPGIVWSSLSPYAPFLGIKAQTELAGSQHAVLFAVYTQESAGYATNRQLEQALTDPANVGPDGRPWAWGLGSVNVYDGYIGEDGELDEAVAQQRLEALSGYFEAHPSLFIGIKMAHAHQGIAFDDPRYLGIYDVAARFDVPVYLHTGLTPFPGATNEPPFYDPGGLDGVVASYPAVRFILGHVGRADARATANAIRMAEEYPNVYLEISALSGPLQIDEHGDALPEVEEAEAQLPSVLAEILARGLVDKTIFGSDGPQGPGAVGRYTALVRETMTAAGYDAEQRAAVMGGNFARVFFPPRD